MGVTKNLVLGGSGLIGSAMCSYLEKSGEQVVNLDLQNGFDLRTDSLNGYTDFDFVWFFAWDVGGAKYLNAQKNQLNIIRNNTMICERVFLFLEKTNKPFLFCSSQLAANDNTYGITKLLGEYWSNLLGGQIARFWNVYGWEPPGERSHVIPDLIMQAITKKSISLFTTGEEERQFIFIDDCVKNLFTIRESKNKITHLTNGEWLKIKDIALMVGKQLNVPVSFGKENGYQNKINPDDSYRKFLWDTSLEKGIELITLKSNDYLKTNV